VSANQYPEEASDLSTCQANIDRKAVCINNRVDFGCEVGTGTSQATIVSVPFFPVAPRVLSHCSQYARAEAGQGGYAS